MSLDSQTICWVVTDGKSGMENQCLGVAEALGLAPIVKRVKLRFPWRSLTPFLRAGLDFSFSRAGDPIEPPWPDLLIATGRLSVPAALHVKRKNPKTFTVQLQDPAVDLARFDLVVAPAHDRLQGPNVMSTYGGLHRVTEAMLAVEAAKFAPAVAHLRRPYIAVLIGGDSGVYRMTPKAIKNFCAQIEEAAIATGGSLLVTPSRRTGQKNLALVKQALANMPAYIWDGQGDNPYYGMLGLVDYILATADSVNMVSEACSTGKPVYVIELPGGSDKFKSFHRVLRADGRTRPFKGRLERWQYKPLDDVGKVAARVREMLQKKE
jgi:mitochondrial fission protein ELM1